MAFFEEHGLTVRETVNANKSKLGASDAKEMLGGMKRMVAVRGKKRVEFDLAAQGVDKEEIVKQMLGPTGNLRAPTLRLGKVLLVGFQVEAYDEFLGD
jgi:arsenate reductase-like glutaredoxin family protein